MASVVEIASTALGVVQAGPDGHLLAHEPVTITNLDASPATHYATVTKTDPQTGPLSSDANGVVPRYIDTGTYLQTVRGFTRRLEAVSGADARSVESSMATKANLAFNALVYGTIQAAVDACSAAGGGEVEVPAGIWSVATAVAIPNFVKVRGHGQTTIVRCTGTNYAFSFSPGNRSAISHLQIDAVPNGVGTGTTTSASNSITSATATLGSFATGQAIYGAGIPAGTTITGVSGSTLTLSANATASGTVTISAGQSAGGGLDYTNSGSNVMVDHVYFGPGLYRSINLAPTGTVTVFLFNRLRWNGIWGTNTGVYIGTGSQLVTDIHFTDVIATANTRTDVQTWFDIARYVDTFTISQALCIKAQTGMLLGSRGTISLVTGPKFSQTVMDSMDGVGFDLVWVRDADFNICSIQGCGSATLPGLRVGPNVVGMRWTGGVVQGCPGDGVLIQTGALYTKMIAAQISDNNIGNNASKNGITVEADTKQFDIINCDIGNNMLQSVGHQKYGIFIATGTSNLFTLAINDLSRNETGALSDGSSGQIKTIWGNKAVDLAGTSNVIIDHWTNSSMYVRDGGGVERVRLSNSGIVLITGQFAANYLQRLNAASGQTANISQYLVNSVLKSAINSGGEFLSDDSAKGIVLKDTQATPHYWRVKVSTTGTLTTTDLGTTRPD